MVVIHRNTQYSECIENFCNLLCEINDIKFVNSVVTSMHKFFTEMFELFYAVDRVAQKKFKSRMLTQQFIDPMRFFGNVKTLADKSMRARAAVELLEHKHTPITVGTDKKNVWITIEDAEKIINANANNSPGYKDWKMLNRMYSTIDREDEFMRRLEDIKETARKEMLVWNHIPAIVKAVIQTKRRSMNMDTNSKKFK